MSLKGSSVYDPLPHPVLAAEERLDNGIFKWGKDVLTSCGAQQERERSSNMPIPQDLVMAAAWSFSVPRTPGVLREHI